MLEYQVDELGQLEEKYDAEYNRVGNPVHSVGNHVGNDAAVGSIGGGVGLGPAAAGTADLYQEDAETDWSKRAAGLEEAARVRGSAGTVEEGEVPSSRVGESPLGEKEQRDWEAREWRDSLYEAARKQNSTGGADT